jgi:hypothetical protein
MTSKLISALCLGLLLSSIANADSDKPVRIRPEEAQQHVGQKVEVVFQVRTAKHSTKRKTTYLDSELDFRDEKNLGVAITEQGASDLRAQRNIESPVDTFRDKTIRVVGTIVIEDERPYLKIDAADQINLVEPDAAAP